MQSGCCQCPAGVGAKQHLYSQPHVAVLLLRSWATSTVLKTAHQKPVLSDPCCLPASCIWRLRRPCGQPGGKHQEPVWFVTLAAGCCPSSPVGARCHSTVGCSIAHRQGRSNRGQGHLPNHCPEQRRSQHPKGSCRSSHHCTTGLIGQAKGMANWLPATTCFPVKPCLSTATPRLAASCTGTAGTTLHTRCGTATCDLVRLSAADSLTRSHLGMWCTAKVAFIIRSLCSCRLT